MMQRMSKSWFDVGMKEALEGKEYNPPEHYSSRMQYREGYESVRSIYEVEDKRNVK